MLSALSHHLTFILIVLAVIGYSVAACDAAPRDIAAIGIVMFWLSATLALFNGLRR